MVHHVSVSPATTTSHIMISSSMPTHKSIDHHTKPKTPQIIQHHRWRSVVGAKKEMNMYLHEIFVFVFSSSSRTYPNKMCDGGCRACSITVTVYYADAWMYATLCSALAVLCVFSCATHKASSSICNSRFQVVELKARMYMNIHCVYVCCMYTRRDGATNIVHTCAKRQPARQHAQPQIVCVPSI